MEHDTAIEQAEVVFVGVAFAVGVFWPLIRSVWKAFFPTRH